MWKSRKGAFLLLASAASIAVFAALEYALPLAGIGPWAHPLAVFTGFTLVPLIALFSNPKSKIQDPKLNRAFTAGIALYLLFFLWLAVLIPRNPSFFREFAPEDAETAAWLVRTWLQVTSVDFFTKALVQREAARLWGIRAGLALQFAAWMAGHIPEFHWLSPLAGPAFAVAFLAATGALTGLVYARWPNVAGQMAGHWWMNVMLVLFVRVGL